MVRLFATIQTTAAQALLIVLALAAVFGGPTKYTGKDLRHGHASLVARGLSDAHFDVVAVHLQSTLEELSVPRHLIPEIMGIVATTRNDVLNR